MFARLARLRQHNQRMKSKTESAQSTSSPTQIPSERSPVHLPSFLKKLAKPVRNQGFRDLQFSTIRNLRTNTKHENK